MDKRIFEIVSELMKGINKNYQELRDYQTQKFKKIIAACKRTPIYKSKVNEEINDLEELHNLPLTFYEDIRRNIDSFGLDNCLLRPYRLKVQTAGSTGYPKEFYYSEKDLEDFAVLGARCGYLFGLRKGDTGWSLTAPPPYISGLLLSLGANKVGCKLIDTPITSSKELIRGLKKISKVNEPIKGIYGFPSILLAIAEISNNPATFKERIEEKAKEKLRLGFLSKIVSYISTRSINFEKISNTLDKAEILVSAGEPISPYEDRIRFFYANAKIFEAYGSTELGIGMVKILEDGHLHPMLDWFIPEIADPIEIRKAKLHPEYEIKSLPWWEWYTGLKGELIITRDGECLPLIRYPTGDLVEVIDPKRNIELSVNGVDFQLTLPEVKVLGRSVEVIPPDISEEEMLLYSVARIYPSEIKLELSKIQKLRVLHYNIFVYSPNKVHPFPRWKLEIIPEKKVLNKVKLERKIKEKIVKKTEIKEAFEPLNLSYNKKLVENLFEVKILEPEAYKEVEREIEKRIREGRPLGQLKPKHVHFIKSDFSEQ